MRLERTAEGENNSDKGFLPPVTHPLPRLFLGCSIFGPPMRPKSYFPDRGLNPHLSSESTEFYPLDGQGIPWVVLFLFGTLEAPRPQPLPLSYAKNSRKWQDFLLP